MQRWGILVPIDQRQLKIALHFGLQTFKGDITGYHGIHHWLRVARNGLYLSGLTSANKKVVLYFSLLHDIARVHDRSDPDHGVRASRIIKQSLAFAELELVAEEIEKLCIAIRLHSVGMTSNDPTVGVCWDADRLDLVRFGTHISRELLSLPQSAVQKSLTFASEIETGIDYAQFVAD